MGISNSASKRQVLRVYLIGLLLAVAAFMYSLPIAQAIARGYKTDDIGIQVGMVVALTDDKTQDSKIERATQQNNQRVVGVVTNSDNSFVTVASATTTVLVESEGEVDAFVSDLNGYVSQGDLLVLSPLKGVLMKAKDGASAPIVGIAAANASSATTSSSYPVEDNGSQKNTTIAKIRINLNRQGAASSGSQEDSSLSKLGKAVVGREVGETRVLVALILFVIVLIAEGGILYGAISSAIIALGRNPLARKVIRQEMIRVIVVALIVLAVGLGAVYAVLWV